MSWTEQTLAGTGSWTCTTSDSTGNIVYATQNAEIYKSSDGGVNWTLLYTAPETIRGVSTNFLGTNVAFFINTAGVYISSDSGESWQTTTETGFKVLSLLIDSNIGQILYAFGINIFAKSTDFGTSWTTSEIFNPSTTLVNRATCSSSGQYIYYLTGNLVYYSSDAGASFNIVQTLLTGYRLVSITCSSNGQNVFMCSNIPSIGITSQIIYVSNDNFTTYNTVTNNGPNFSSISCDSTGQNIAISSNNELIYVSTNSGVNFTQNFSVTGGTWGQIKINSSGSFIVAMLTRIGVGPGSIYTYGTAGPGPDPPPIVCFKEGSKILTESGYKPIEDLRKGDLVKTLKHGFLPINMIGKRDIYNPSKKDRIKDQLYKCSKEKYPEILEDLVITGCHSILVDRFTSNKQKEKAIEVNNGKLCITDNKYRLPACVDERASIYEVQGNFTIYHIALENDDYYMNYGIYANGLLVETCSKRYLKELSNMTLL
jgi:hypothetical protein